MAITNLFKETDNCSGKKNLALAIAESYKEGEGCVTEYLCAGDPVYLVLIAANIIVEAEDRLGITTDELELLLEKVKKELKRKVPVC